MKSLRQWQPVALRPREITVSCNTVVFHVFNRPDTTRRVFDAIAAARPRRLLIIADGPRTGRPNDRDLCRQTREVVERIDWPCDVGRHYSERNMGCRDRIASGLDWVFQQVDEAIVLEDDCLPDPTFFRYASELLERYRHDERVMAISGDTFQPQPPPSGESYYFSRYFHCWGWATWKRAWAHYDVAMRDWPRVSRTSWLSDQIDGDVEAARFWSKQFAAVHEGHLNTWDYQFVFACWKAGGMTVLPRRNLVANIGFRSDATHTSDVSSRFAGLPTEPMNFPLIHPPVVRDCTADEWSQRQLFSTPAAGPRRRSMFRKAVAFLSRPLIAKRPAA